MLLPSHWGAKLGEMFLDVLSFETLSPKQAYETENVHLAFRLQALARQRLRAILAPRPGRADECVPNHRSWQRLRRHRQNQVLHQCRRPNRLHHYNGFTLLENNPHYLDNGAWQVSEDLVEIVPGGAAAQRGPDKAFFSPDLNSEAVFDITTADGLRLQGGVRAI